MDEENYILKINHKTKDMVRDIVREVFNQEYKKEMRNEIYRFISDVGKEVVIEELKKINPSHVIVERFDNLLKQNFTPIIQKVVNMSAQKVSSKVNKQLKRVVELKTSTIMEIQNEVMKIPVETEEESLKQLSQDFPEYYKQITNENRLKIN